MLEGPSHPMPEQHCPICGGLLKRATALENPIAVPKPGDVTVCIDCGGWLVFGEGLALERMPARVAAELDPRERRSLLATTLGVRQVKARAN
jgi:hypothetical protein